MKKILLFTLLVSLLLGDSELDFETDFLDSLDEVSEIATKTKLNIDDSPSFVTILHSEKLQKLGITNVFEALSQVPGVQLKREKSGVLVVVFRGVSQKGEVKLMLDGVTINNTYRGSIYYFLDFPIELIERIEVIRGAGSVLYGSGAISGVVNIITKSANDDNKNNLFISGGTYDNYSGGAILSTLVGDVKVSVDGYYQNSDKTIETTDRDLTDYSVGLNVKDEHLGVIARVKQSEQGNAYGIFTIPDTNKNRYSNINEAIFAQLSYKNRLGKDNHIELLTGYSQYTQDVETRHSLAGTINAKYSENAYYAQVDFKSNIIKNNELLFGTRVEFAKVLESTLATIAAPDLERDTFSFYFNDKYTLTPDLDISAGLRYDNYSDFGDAFSPTLSLIYRVTKEFRLKALYTNAFRAPSWVELTSNSELKAETSNSYELGFVYKKDPVNVLRLNIYKTTLNDMITKDGTYVQNSTGTFQGAELEYIYTPLRNLELNLLSSYVDAKDNDNNNIPDVANILTSASALYEFNSGISISTLLKYVSSSKRSDTDIRDDMSDSTLLDGTLTYMIKDLTLSLIVKDIFDKGTYYALPTSTTNNDFYDGGRSLFLKAGWEF